MWPAPPRRLPPEAIRLPPDLAASPLSIHLPLYAIRHAQIGGTEWSIYNLIKGLYQAGARLTLSYGRDGDLSPEFDAWLAHTPAIHAARRGGLPGPKNVRFLEETLFSLRATDDEWALYPNYFSPPRLRSSGRRRAVILHDIQYRVLPHYHSAKRRAWLDAYLPFMFRTVDRVSLVSHSEASLVREHFGDAAAAKCAVVPNAIDWTRFENAEATLPAETRARLELRYILSVCHPFPHKNVATLLRAFGRVAAEDGEIQLYLIGAASDRNREFIRAQLPAAQAAQVHVLGFVDDQALGAYYAHATLFVLPSLYEGFGMPAVEAMGFGLPTLVSRAFSLPEVTLGAADYVDDPLAEDEWHTRLTAALAGGPTRLDATVVARIRTTYAPAAVGGLMIQALRAAGPDR